MRSSSSSRRRGSTGDDVATTWWVVCISGGLTLIGVTIRAMTTMHARNVASREKTRREQIKAERDITIERLHRDNDDKVDDDEGGRGGT